MSEGFVHRLLRDIGRAEVRAMNEEERMKFTVEELEEIGRQVMAADEQADRKESLAAQALEILGRQVMDLRGQFAVSDGDPVWFSAWPGERKHSYVVTLKSDAGWKATAIIDITITDAEPGEGA
jgi:hypothetical protein